jgi:hypothetical protein
MTWEFMRLGWPNTAAIFALAVLPIVVATFDRLDRSGPLTTALSEVIHHPTVGANLASRR